MKLKIKFSFLTTAYLLLSFLTWLTKGLKFFQKRKLALGSFMLAISSTTVIAQESENEFSIKSKGIDVKQSLQTNKDTIITSCYETIYVPNEEIMPEFPDGDKALYDFLDKNKIYPDSAKKHGIVGTVTVHVTIDKTGKIINPIILKGIGYSCDEEALRLIKLLPDFKPGKKRNKPANIDMVIPIKFNPKDK